MNTDALREFYDSLVVDDWNSYDRLAEHYAYSLPQNAEQYDNTDAMKRAVRSSGSHFFDPEAVRLFRGRTDGQMFGRRFWVESRKYVDTRHGWSDPREYMVAYVYRYGDSLTVERLGKFDTIDKARRAARKLAELVEEG